MPARPDYRTAIEASGLIDRLAPFDPHVAGTPPLGIDLPASDIDILCHAPDPAAFAALVWEAWRTFPDFALRQWTGGGRPMIASFVAHGWPFEIFAATMPVADQDGWRHFLVERRLLDLGGPAFRNAVMARRRQGLKTEPAFAAVLGLADDPYAALLALAQLSDSALGRMVADAGFSSRHEVTDRP